MALLTGYVTHNCPQCTSIYSKVKVLLIQPTDPPDAYFEATGFPTYPVPFAVSSALLHVQNYILHRSRHECAALDLRQYADGPDQIRHQVREADSDMLLALYTTPANLKSAMDLVRILRSELTETRIALWGPLPSQYPNLLPYLKEVDFCLCGDPEPLLKRILDYYDQPKRLERIQGVYVPSHEASPAPRWLESLESMCFNDWTGPEWERYRQITGLAYTEAEFSLTRGQTQLPPDIMFSGDQEPLRYYDMDMLANLLQKCSNHGINHVFVKDSPAVWSPEILDQWCHALKVRQNVQSWGLQMLPTHLGAEEIEDLSFASCKRIDFIYPSCDPDQLAEYGCIVTPREVRETVEELEEYRIKVMIQYWVGGPMEEPGEAARICRTVEELQYTAFTVHPYPFHFDAPLFRERFEMEGTPSLKDWLRLAVNAEAPAQPVPQWPVKPGGMAPHLTTQHILHHVDKSPRRIMQRWTHRLGLKKLHVLKDIITADRHPPTVTTRPG